MQTIYNDSTLQRAILDLEQQKSREAVELRDHWDITKKSLNPLTMVKDGVKELFVAPDMRSGLLKGLLSLGTGFLTKKLIVGNSGGAVRKIVGTIAQTGATGLAYKGSDALKEKGAPFLSKLLKKIKIG